MVGAGVSIGYGYPGQLLQHAAPGLFELGLSAGF